MSLYKPLSLGVMSLGIALLVISCARGVRTNNSKSEAPSDPLYIAPESRQASAQPARLRVMRGIGKTSVSSVAPPELLLVVGQSLTAELQGSGLDAVRGLRVLRGNTEASEIRGQARCRDGKSCTLELAATPKAKVANYKLALLDKNNNILTNVPTPLMVVDASDFPPVTISSIAPPRLEVTTGRSIDAAIRGTGLKAVRGIQVELQGEESQGIQGQITCVSDTDCKVSLSVTRFARTNQHQIALLDQNGKVLVYLPVALIVRAPKIPPRADQPDAILAAPEQPGVSVSRLCEEPIDGTSMRLILPLANDALTVATEVQWLRTEIDTCIPSGGDYHLYFCRSEVDCLNAEPNHIIASLGWNPNILVNGVASLSGLFDAIGTTLSVAEGDVVYLQMQFTAADGQTGPPTPPRPLIYGGQPCSGDCPPELWTPRAGSRIHATNKSFYWSDDGTAASWDICLKPASSSVICNRQIRTTDNSLTGLSYYDFDEWNLAGTEIEWKVRACAAPDDNQCGEYSVPRGAKVPFSAPDIIQPTYGAEVSLPHTATWEAVPGAESYRLILSHTTSQPEHHVDWIIRDSIPTTSYTFTATDFQDPPGGRPGLLERFFSGSGSALRVDACYEASDGDSVCSEPEFSFFSDDVHLLGTTGIIFTDNPQTDFSPLYAAFRSPSCVNCHAVVNTGFARGGDGTFGLPSAHPVINSGTNCMTCHESTLQQVLPFSTHPDIPWQAAPSDADFRAGDGQLLSDFDLCQKAIEGGDVIPDPVEHLTEDPLILWAVIGGPRPIINNEPPAINNAPPAFGQGGVDVIPEWKALVHAWANANMPCPPQ